ncbi:MULTISPECIES: Cys-tRNA(Pro) deacylase [Staphylococcus]|uniref:Cys-tRNA(Pro)/Cys-tRNA(Cys) deacylase n=1 Tax=Staphylococcus xylosus TaxID=1288 RepID=A0A418IKT5_STAXY|nr:MULTISPECIES: Cys-tRNA(Pro) deacylase [Staphylococcus]MBF0812925.1 Cys-tRNA(Pro) deacylase [Staphylococcus saprophyticus]MRF36741.1 Cys-tRNA(Pro) deacylase [Staphylococcus sp. KY49P]MDW8561227.1 Cys-tRNA(Pro) deacylase [Staphylococcus sp. KG4-3]NQD97936.1 Cys-tRNA(Pro) deacylase [Staphylococcus xylosus]PTI05034.1 Cys-tRNA(Pro) deacylase [Staphylococcus xylosus]
MKQKKTNAMRILDSQAIAYSVNTYDISTHHMDGEHVAQKVGVDPDHVYKTLVLENAAHEHFVFIIPVNKTLDMKTAAQSVTEKKLNLMPLEQLKKVTGYIRGGCSPIGMKRQFPTVIDQNAQALDSIYISGGDRGVQINIRVKDLIAVTQAQVMHIIQETK